MPCPSYSETEFPITPSGLVEFTHYLNDLNLGDELEVLDVWIKERNDVAVDEVDARPNWIDEYTLVPPGGGEYTGDYILPDGSTDNGTIERAAVEWSFSASMPSWAAELGNTLLLGIRFTDNVGDPVEDEFCLSYLASGTPTGLIVFASNNGVYSRGFDAADDEEYLVTTGRSIPGRWPSFDGTDVIYYAGRSGPDIFIHKVTLADNTDSQILTHSLGNNPRNLVWDPASNQMLLCYSGTVYAFNNDGSGFGSITAPPDTHAIAPPAEAGGTYYILRLVSGSAEWHTWTGPGSSSSTLIADTNSSDLYVFLHYRDANNTLYGIESGTVWALNPGGGRTQVKAGVDWFRVDGDTVYFALTSATAGEYLRKADFPSFGNEVTLPMIDAADEDPFVSQEINAGEFCFVTT